MRCRPRGRIGGIAGRVPNTAAEALRRELGADALVLAPSGPDLVGDWDACYLDGRPVEDLRSWRGIVSAGRLPDVSGAFALAWRDDTGAVRLARDAIGERSLHYADAGDGLLFASRLPPILRAGLHALRLDGAAVAAYLSCAYVPGRETLVSGVKQVEPGEIVTWRDGAESSGRFWELPAEEEFADEEAVSRRLRAELERAVAHRLPPGEAVGATLSGGIDSSLVVAMARRLSEAPVHTYSVAFGPEHRSELPWSSLVAAHCGVTHRVVTVDAATVRRELDRTMGALDGPIGDPLTVPNAVLFRAAAEEVSVVLNGEGGDPCFGGPKNSPMLLAELLGDAMDPARARERSYLRSHQKCFDDLGAMLEDELQGALAEAPLERLLTPWFQDPRFRTFVGRLCAINCVFKGAHHILPKVDALSALAGVLPRSPLFDRAVVELAAAIPPQLKLRGAVEKYVLKRAVQDLLPAAILDRPKSGMLVPVEAWFRADGGPLLPYARERLLDGLARRGLVRRGYLEDLLEGRSGGLRPRRGAKIWLLLALESWIDALPGPVSSHG